MGEIFAQSQRSDVLMEHTLCARRSTAAVAGGDDDDDDEDESWVDEISCAMRTLKKGSSALLLIKAAHDVKYDAMTAHALIR